MVGLAASLALHASFFALVWLLTGLTFVRDVREEPVSLVRLVVDERPASVAKPAEARPGRRPAAARPAPRPAAVRSEPAPATRPEPVVVADAAALAPAAAEPAAAEPPAPPAAPAET